LKHTWKAGTNRVFGTAIGAFMGLVAMHIRIIWDLKTPSITYYLIITLMMFFVIWLTISYKNSRDHCFLCSCISFNRFKSNWWQHIGTVCCFLSFCGYNDRNPCCLLLL